MGCVADLLLTGEPCLRRHADGDRRRSCPVPTGCALEALRAFDSARARSRDPRLPAQTCGSAAIGARVVPETCRSRRHHAMGRGTRPRMVGTPTSGPEGSVGTRGRIDVANLRVHRYHPTVDADTGDLVSTILLASLMVGRARQREVVNGQAASKASGTCVQSGAGRTRGEVSPCQLFRVSRRYARGRREAGPEGRPVLGRPAGDDGRLHARPHEKRMPSSRGRWLAGTLGRPPTWRSSCTLGTRTVFLRVRVR